jgi:DHA1 family multidrug resistance protein-like MFS transporter
MFWFAWTGEYNSIHWIVPTLAGVFLSTSILLIFVAYLNYLTDTYLMYAASALAANTVCRSACGAAAPLFTQYMFDALGVGGGGSLIAGAACLLAPIPFVFYWYGEPIRRRSKFAPTEDGGKEKEGQGQQRPRDEEEGVGSSATLNSVSVEGEEEGEIEKKDDEGIDSAGTQNKDGEGQLDGGLWTRNSEKDVESDA